MKRTIKILTLLSFFTIVFVSCHKEKENIDPEFIDFGEVKFNEPFRGLFASRNGILEKSLEYPPYSWAVPDTTASEISLWIDVNQEALRGNARTKFLFKDPNGTQLPIEFFINGIPENDYVFLADSLHKELKVTAVVPHDTPTAKYSGRLYVYTTDIDSINREPVLSEENIANEWVLQHKIGIGLGLWSWWIFTILLLLAIIVLMIWGLIYLLPYLVKLFRLPRIKIPKGGPFDNWDIKRRKPKRRKFPKDKKKWYTDPWIGDDYDTKNYFGRKNVMGLGDFHYCANPNDFTPDITIRVIENLFDPNHIHEPYMATYAKFINAVIGSRLVTNQEKEWGWNQISFYNYTQFPIKDSHTVPTDQQYRDSEEAFWAVMDYLQPSHVIVWGYRLFGHLPLAKRHYVGSIRIFGGKNAEVYEYRMSLTKTVKVLRMKSPAFGYSPARWSKIIRDFLIW